MNPEHQQIFNQTPDDDPRSRLEPYRELILRWRRQGRTYHRICQLLAENCGVKIAYGPLYRYIQRRSRPRTKEQDGSTSPIPASAQSLVERNDSAPFVPGIRRSPEEIAAMREAARALNHKPNLPVEPEKERFVYDPNRPLTNKPITRKEK